MGEKVTVDEKINDTKSSKKVPRAVILEWEVHHVLHFFVYFGGK